MRFTAYENQQGAVKVPREVTARVVAILKEEIGLAADEAWLRGFYAHQEEGCREYRLPSRLGFGGKFRTHLLFDRPRFYVDCYPEDSTPERLLAIGHANERLRALVDEVFEMGQD